MIIKFDSMRSQQTLGNRYKLGFKSHKCPLYSYLEQELQKQTSCFIFRCTSWTASTLCVFIVMLGYPARSLRLEESEYSWGCWRSECFPDGWTEPPPSPRLFLFSAFNPSREAVPFLPTYWCLIHPQMPGGRSQQQWRRRKKTKGRNCCPNVCSAFAFGLCVMKERQKTAGTGADRVRRGRLWGPTNPICLSLGRLQG